MSQAENSGIKWGLTKKQSPSKTDKPPRLDLSKLR